MNAYRIETTARDGQIVVLGHDEADARLRWEDIAAVSRIDYPDYAIEEGTKITKMALI